MSGNQISGEGGRFQVSGELGFNTVNAVLAESKGILFSSKGVQLELDLAEVSRADSAGLALLIEWMRMAQANSCEIKFHHLPAQLLEIARAGELEALLPVGV